MFGKVIPNNKCKQKHGYDFQITEEAADMFGGNNGTSDQKRQLLLLEAHILLGYHLYNFL